MSEIVIKEKIKSNITLLEMWVGIVLFVIVCQVSIVWFVSDKSSFSIGLWLGGFVAILSTLHLSISLERALDFDEGGAKKHMVIQNLVRYFVLIVFLGLLMITDFANPLSAFLGIMGIKMGAYLQPFIHKVFSKMKNKNK